MPADTQSVLAENNQAQAPILRMEGITKAFPGVVALNQVDFDLLPGEVHVLAGENGAGKSTLNKIISGVYQPDAGEIYFNEQKTIIKNPNIARQMGVGTVYQELSLVPHMTVLENLFLGIEMTGKLVLGKGKMSKRAQAAVTSLGFPLDLNAKVSQINISHRQMVEIARHVLKKNRILILDEPTSALTKEEIDKLFFIINKLKRSGVAIIYISHRLNELQEIGDRVTILRDGEKVTTIEIDEATEQRLIELMTGRRVEKIFPSVESKPGQELFKVSGMSTEKEIQNINLTLHSGEVLGVGGLIGSGKTALARSLFGLGKMVEGQVELLGKKYRRIDPSLLIKKGVVYIPADRRAEGILALLSIRENIAMPNLSFFIKGGVLNKTAQKIKVAELSRRLQIKAPSMEMMVHKLSGGNQQKVIVARTLVRDTKVFIFHELTRGIDIGTKIEIYKFVQELAKQGAGVIFVSSEMAELLHVTHRIAVMRDGRIAEVFNTQGLDEEMLLKSFFGVQEMESGATANEA